MSQTKPRNLLISGSAEPFREIVAASADAIVGIDETRAIVLFNRAAEELFQYPVDSILGRKIECLLPPEARAAHARHVEAFRAGGDASRYMGDRSGILKGLRADGTVLPVAVSIQLVATDDRKLMIAQLREISHHVRLKEKLVKLASVDHLTQTFNRRAFVEFSTEIHNACINEGTGYTVLLMDLDHFKQLNDTHGHPAGDFVLREFARICQSGLRGDDILARWGGEEFIVLLPRTDRITGRAIAERLQTTVAGFAFRFTEETVLRQTVSIGLANWHGAADRLDDIINRADAALYAGKLAGRNRVMCEPDPAGP
ncbi:GGDEF domain-containing protein [Salinihabitans flavidus]|nr:sensor domain-containing diguanylate cyclase [Salinihabitans flavidus]